MCHNVAQRNEKYYEVLFLILFHTDPPFGKKSSVTIVNEAGDEEKQSLVVHRDDFRASTSKCEPHWHYSSTSSSTSLRS
jgi:hypothetical protein